MTVENRDTVAASPLLMCGADDELEGVLARPDLKGIYQIPIVKNGRIAALWDRSRSWERRALDDSVLVSADAPLWEFIHTVHNQPYRLVVDKTEIAVTWSGLLKVPVLVLGFSLLAELELAMNRRILQEHAEDAWLSFLE